MKSFQADLNALCEFQVLKKKIDVNFRQWLPEKDVFAVEPSNFGPQPNKIALSI